MRKRSLSILAVALSTACGVGPAPQALESLNQELASTPYREAMANKAHFAPLCDEQGYPLVGNIVSKVGTTASGFCAALRASPP